MGQNENGVRDSPRALSIHAIGNQLGKRTRNLLTSDSRHITVSKMTIGAGVARHHLGFSEESE